MGNGRIELRAGGVHNSSYGGSEGEAALVEMRWLKEGTYELAQRLPNLAGGLGSAAECRGDLSQNSVIEIMRLCEDQALSCTITVIADFERAEIVYRAGDITKVLFNGRANDDAVVDVVRWKRGKFRVTVPPLALDIDGWPTTSKDPTIPFSIADIAKMAPPAKKSVAKKPAANKKSVAKKPAAKPAREKHAARKAATPGPHIPVVESFHHAPRLDPSGQLTMMRSDVLVTPESGGWFSLFAVMMFLCGLWVAAAVMINKL